ncbi:hypothetical protein ACLK1T_21440 [Escherichia coli]
MVAESADELLALFDVVRQGIDGRRSGCPLGWPLEKARNASNSSFLGTLRKRSRGYRLKPVDLSEVPGVLQHPA